MVIYNLLTPCEQRVLTASVVKLDIFDLVVQNKVENETYNQLHVDVCTLDQVATVDHKVFNHRLRHFYSNLAVLQLEYFVFRLKHLRRIALSR